MNKILSGLKILAVEDEMLVLINIEDMLADLGCESVKAASTVKEALALVESQNFDIALLDMNLDGEQTYSVADMLNAHGVKFAFATGYGVQGIAESYRHHPILTKPIRPKDLAETLKRLLN